MIDSLAMNFALGSTVVGLICLMGINIIEYIQTLRSHLLVSSLVLFLSSVVTAIAAVEGKF